MVRVKRGNVSLRKKKKIFRFVKGYVGSNSRLSTFASEQVVQSLQFSYISRRLKKRNFRKIWIMRINTIVRNLNTTYSQFIGDLKKKNIFLDRKMLSFLAFNHGNIYKILSQI